MLRMPEVVTLFNILSLIIVIRKMTKLKKIFRDKLVYFGCYDKEYKKVKIKFVLKGMDATDMRDYPALHLHIL
jgi:hypothetical protein